MKLSIGIITYNHERFIGEAIQSVLSQNVNFDYEIVIGEDRSTDETRAVVQEFQRRHPDKIKLLLRDANLGMMRNFAETVAACRGHYLAFLEGDDYWTAKDKLQKQVDYLDAHADRAICCSRVRSLYEGGMENFDTRWDVFPLCPAGPYTVEDLLKGNFVATCTAVLRREFIERFPKWFFKMKVGDWPLWAMVARHGKIELMDDIMAAYRVHPGGAWSSLPHIAKLGEAARMLRALDKELGYRYSKTIREFIAPAYLELAMTARLRGRRVETVRHLVNGIRNGALRLPIGLPTFGGGGPRTGPRLLGGLAAYALVGSSYKMFSRANSKTRAEAKRERL